MMSHSLKDKFTVDPEHLGVALKNFDLCRNIFYVVIEITQPSNGMQANYLGNQLPAIILQCHTLFHSVQ